MKAVTCHQGQLAVADLPALVPEAVFETLQQRAGGATRERMLRELAGALETLTKNTAYALLRNRIRVNGLNIGWMASEGEDRIQREYHNAPADWLEKAAAAQPFGRLVDPAEVARACVYLSSSESGLMTGSVICFDQSIWGAYEASPQPAEAM